MLVALPSAARLPASVRLSGDNCRLRSSARRTRLADEGGVTNSAKTAFDMTSLLTYLQEGCPIRRSGSCLLGTLSFKSWALTIARLLSCVEV